MQLEREMQQALQKTAEVAEQIAKDKSGEFWDHDSHSAVESITGFNPEVEPFDKNFSNWEYAWGDPNYTSPEHGNPHTNFVPVVEQESRNGDYEAYLTMFVEYADEIDGDKLIGEVTDDVGGTLGHQVAQAFKRAVV
jgi:hypothetical protein